MKKVISALVPVIIFSLLVFLTVGCAHPASFRDPIVSTPFGFLGGLWHGMILPVSIFGRLLTPDVIYIYSPFNSGVWYDIGYVSGIGILFAASKLKKDYFS